MVEELLQLGANLEKESLMSKPLTQAVVLGQMEKVELLLRYGANPNAHQSTVTNALLEATRYGYSQIARLLLDHGANPRDRGLDGIDATQLAERANREDLVILYATRRLDGNAPKPRTSNHRASRPKR